MHRTPLVLLSLGLITLLSTGAVKRRTIDELNTYSGTGSVYRIDDSTSLHFGRFTLISRSGNTQVSAHRLLVGAGAGHPASEFSSDIVRGFVYTDGVNVSGSRLLLPDMVHISADAIAYSRDWLTVELTGHATLKCDDVTISSHSITLTLHRWKGSDL
jgi:hypothetical protein